MPDERPFTLRQIDQARSDFYAIGDDLEFIKSQLARLPTRKEMARTALLVTLTTAALVILWFEAFGFIR
jgi:hypothetical protein